MAKQKPTSEDHLLAPEQFGDMNKRFFTETSGPHVFIRHRMRGVMLAATRSEHIAAAFEAGIEIGTLRAEGDYYTDVSDRDLEQFAALESIILFHHAAETLLRLTLALEGDHPCPWLEITRLRRPGEFPKRVKSLKARLTSEETQDALARIFYYRKDRNTVPEGISAQDWEEGLRGLTSLLFECINRYETESALYNSAKHGLSAVQGNAGMTLQTGAGKAFLHNSGPSLTIVEARQVQSENRRKWHETTHWIEADRTLGLTHVVSNMIENLWTIARRRYVDQSLTSGLNRVDPKVVDATRPQGHESEIPGVRYIVPSFSMSLLYYKDPEPVARNARRQGSQSRRR
jgi:hypothetical protein